MFADKQINWATAAILMTGIVVGGVLVAMGKLLPATFATAITSIFTAFSGRMLKTAVPPESTP